MEVGRVLGNLFLAPVAVWLARTSGHSLRQLVVLWAACTSGYDVALGRDMPRHDTLDAAVGLLLCLNHGPVVIDFDAVDVTR